MKKKTFPILLAFLIVSLPFVLSAKDYKTEQFTDPNGYSYTSVTNDPTATRIYTLANGLKVYLSKNTDEPRIQTYVPVRTGSNNDPNDNTGLAHYLEHMLFKGTDKIASLDWDKERVLIKAISDLYEKHKAESSPEKRKKIYKQIDSISQEAAKYVAANEYDKLISSIGGKGVNAHTWYEETVYKSNIPSNELESWLKIESERFSKLVLRLFHTELETVYEEFNRAQDNDYRLVYYDMLDALFSKHPYGQKTTIGTSEHLKSPSMVAIHKYFDTYYVPNNFAIVLVGDLDYDRTIVLVDKYFGKYKANNITKKLFPREEPIEKPIVREVFSKSAELVSMAFRIDGGRGSEDAKYLTLIDMILANGTAGLIDLNINQPQKTLGSTCSPSIMNEYSYHKFTGKPKEGQTLDQVRDLLLGEIDKVKKGDFPEWLIDAVINDLELSYIRGLENAKNVATKLYKNYISEVDWVDELSFYKDLRKITKKDLVKFARKYYQNNYVIVYKRKGVNKKLIKVENPGITPLKLEKNKKSAFASDLSKHKSDPIKPKFVDYKKSIKHTKVKGYNIDYILNTSNNLFDLAIIFDMGKYNDKKISLAMNYLDYLGTDSMTPKQIKEEFYKLGVMYDVNVGNKKMIINLSGLNRNLDKGVKLLETLIANVKPNKLSYNKMVDRILTRRKNNKLSKSYILYGGLMSYGKYGEKSPFRDVLPKEELENINPNELTDILKTLLNYKHRIFYYGSDIKGVKKALGKYHNFGKGKDYPVAKKYKNIETGGHVYFVDYDMVQTQFLMIKKGRPFDVKNMVLSYLFNNYFGSGLSSIVFQEIREARSLAYSASAFYSNAGEKDDYNYVISSVGTQVNKLPEALDAMFQLMNNMPEIESALQVAKASLIKTIASQRITKKSIFYKYESLKKRGIDYDIRKDIYEQIKLITMEDLREFFLKSIKGKDYTLLLIGNKKDIPLDKLKKFGKVQEMNVDYLFNY